MQHLWNSMRNGQASVLTRASRLFSGSDSLPAISIFTGRLRKRGKEERQNGCCCAAVQPITKKSEKERFRDA